MQKPLQHLIELQEIEKMIQTLTEQKARAPEQIAALEEEVRSSEASRNHQEDMLEAARKLRLQLEREVEDLEHRVAKSRQRLLEVKTNKEYQALLKEIDDLQGFIREREDRILEQMEAVERHQKLQREEERLVARTHEKIKQETARLEAMAVRADTLIQELNEQQERLNPQIPADLLKLYQFLKFHRGGVAVAPVVETTCQVCHMNLPPQVFIDLQKDEQLLHCPTCQRFIYWVGHKDYQSAAEVLQGLD